VSKDISQLQAPFFKSIDPQLAQSISQELPLVEVSQGEIVMHEEEPGDYCFIIQEGNLEVVKALGTQEERVVWVHKAGAIVGEGSLFDPHAKRSATVRAQTDCKLLRMSHLELEKLLRMSPGFAFELARFISTRERLIDNQTILDLRNKNEQLTRALSELEKAQVQIIEKEKLEQELKVGHQIQLSILPKCPPAKKGFDFGVILKPARLVGGDLYDFFYLDDDTMAILIGDVSDKGVPAGIFMSLVRSLFRADSSEQASPVQVLSKVNGHLLTMNDRGLFVTVLFGILKLSTGQFTYGRAGHELPFVIEINGHLFEPEMKSGRLLGITSEIDIEEDVLIIKPGSTLFLYTDGAIDAINPAGERLGIELLHQTAKEQLNPTSQKTCDQVLAAIQAFAGNTPQADDIALLTIHRAT
jgi:serine phosphatase RsbU (regulator of sigma subunit)